MKNPSTFISELRVAHRNKFRAARNAAIISAALFCAAGPWATNARAQGSRKDDVVFNSRGQPLSGATVRVCAATATTTSPCTPLALIYSDVALTQALANPTTSDGMGNYNFYAAPGRYVLEISGPSITTRQIRDVILPNDPSQPITFSSITTSGNISGFTLSLAGNLTVAGSAAITGTLTVGGAPVPSTSQANVWAASQTFKGPSPWRDVTAFGAKCDGSTDDTAAFQAAFNAALADPGGTVYIPWSPASANGCIVKSGITIAPHSFWLNVLQVGNITIPTGGSSLIDSGTGSTNDLYWLGVPGQGAGIPQSFGEPSAPTINDFANVPAFRLHSDQVRLENLDFRCFTSSANCLDFFAMSSAGFADITLQNVNAGVGSGSTGSALNFDCSAALAGGNGCFGVTVVGGVYFVNTIASTHASIIFRDCGSIVIGDPTRKMTLLGYGILIQDDGTGSGSGLSHVQNILTENLNGALVTANVATGGAGINSLQIDRVDVADCATVCSIVSATGLSTGSVNGIAVENSSGAPLLDSASHNVVGVWSKNNFEVDDIGTLPTGTDVTVQEPGIFNVFAGHPNGVAFATKGAVCLGCLTNTFMTQQTADTALHVIDNLNGGNGMGYSSLPGAGSGATVREDSASSAAYHTFESPNGGAFTLLFCRPTGGCNGSISYVHPNGLAFVTEGQTQMYMGDSLGGVSIRRGFQFLNGGSNALTFGGSFSAARTQNFQDISGTIALTSQLPLSGTTSSIGGSALAAGICTTGTASVTGVSTAMAVAVSPAADPGTGFTWNAWVSSTTTVTVRVCNISGASATPTATAYNVRVSQ
jgi:Pectate lyase superfamily protein